MDITTLEEEIEMILTEEETARADDMALYAIYLEWRDADITTAFNDRRYRVERRLSSFESVSRCRRRLQSKYPELKPSDEVVAIRKEEEKKWREYARG